MALVHQQNINLFFSNKNENFFWLCTLFCLKDICITKLDWKLRDKKERKRSLLHKKAKNLNFWTIGYLYDTSDKKSVVNLVKTKKGL